MELVEGETLAQRIAKEPLPVEEALEVCRQIAEGLEAAHEKGIFILDGNGVLCYWCTVIDNKKVGGAGRQAFAEEAAGALHSGKPVPHAQAREFGWAIRRTY